MVLADRRAAKLCPTAITDQTPTCEKINDRIDQYDHAQHDDTRNHFIGPEQRHRTDRSGNDDDKARHLRKISPGKQLPAATRRTTPQMMLIIKRPIPIQVDIASGGCSRGPVHSIRRTNHRRWCLGIDGDPKQPLAITIS